MYVNSNTLKASDNAANCFKSEKRIVKGEVSSESKNVNPQIPNSSPLNHVAAAEKVFLIDHIRDLIFLECDRQTLLTSRLVSRRWAHFSSKALQKIVKIKLALKNLHYLHQFAGSKRSFLVLWNDGRSVDDLTALMQRSTTEFPCNSFSFSDVDPANFFKLQGHLVKKLKIEGSISLDSLKRLLWIEAPNLEHLSMRQLTVTDHDDFSKREKSRFNEMFQKQTHFLENLKVFKCNFQTPPNFVQQVLEQSPNLAHVLLPNKYLHFLVRPVNRLHLLKILKIDFRNLHFIQLQLLAKQHDGHLALEEISIFGVFNFREDLYFKAVDDVSTILKLSAATCKTLVLDGALKNLEIPQMPRVKHLSFGCREVDGQPFHMFLKGVSLGETFPNLKSLEIRSSYIRGNIQIGRFFGVEDPGPVPSVRNIYLRLFQPHDDLLRRFSEMFPNAASDPHCIDY